MTDLSLAVNELLAKRQAPATCITSHSLDHVNEFLKQAYQINSRIAELTTYLRSIRRPYLSTAPPPRQAKFSTSISSRTSAGLGSHHFYLSDTQRDSIDAEAKSTLRDIHAAVTQLSQAERVDHEAALARIQARRRKRGFGALGQWAAGGAAQEASPDDAVAEQAAGQVKECRDGVLWFLQVRLRECGEVQGLMMETRITREVEREKSILHKSHAPMPRSRERTGTLAGVVGDAEGRQQVVRGSGLPPGEMNGHEAEPRQPELSQEQMTIFAEENQDMLKHYEDRLDQVRSAERSLTEISELQSTLAQNLEIQSEHIEQLTTDSYTATKDVGKGNKELKRASERKSTAKMVFYGTVSLCSFFVIWDLII